MKKTFISAAAAMIAVAVLFGSCEKNDYTADFSKPEITESTSVYTSVYKGSSVVLHDGQMTAGDILPCCNNENNTIQFISYIRDDVFNDDGVYMRSDTTYYLVTADSKLNILSTDELMLNGKNLGLCCLMSDKLYMLDTGYDKSTDEYSVCVAEYTFADKKYSIIAELTKAYNTFDVHSTVLYSMRVDADGRIYIADDCGITVFEPAGESGEYKKLLSLPLVSDGTVLSLSPDGRMYAGTEFEDGFGTAEINLSTKKLDNITYCDKIVCGIFFDRDSNMYVAAQDGLYKHTSDGITMIMSFTESNINADASQITAVLDEETA